MSGLLTDMYMYRCTHARFAPLHIPPHRRWQTAAVATWALLLPLCLFVFLMLACVLPICACEAQLTGQVVYLDLVRAHPVSYLGAIRLCAQLRWPAKEVGPGLLLVEVLCS